jgi:hypothetical protein
MDLLVEGAQGTLTGPLGRAAGGMMMTYGNE